MHGEPDESLVDRESERDCEEYQESQNCHLTVVELLYAHHWVRVSGAIPMGIPVPFPIW